MFMSIVIAILMLYTSINFVYRYNANKTTLTYETKFLAKLVSQYTITPLVFQDNQGAKESLQQLENIQFIDSALLYDLDNKLFASYVKDKSVTPEDINFVEGFYHDQLYIKVPVSYKEEHYGQLVLIASTDSMYLKLSDELLDIVLVLLLILLITYFIVARSQSLITAPITKLAKLAQSITRTQDYSLRADKVYNDEVGTLYDEFNFMLSTLQRRGEERDEAEAISQQHQLHLERLTEELEQRVLDRTTELQQSIELIKQTQTQLVEAEKMSSLGNLVAGVAHEVNTPLGISITASSIFSNEIQEVKTLLQNNQLTQTRLQTFLETFEEASALLTLNLNRAALLIKNFKQIAVDQTSESRREFELNDYLREISSTFSSEFKRHKVTLHLSYNRDKVIMNSLPGVLSQVIVNLIQNSLIHAFVNTTGATITLEVIAKENNVTIVYQDNGIGIDKSVQKNLFEPFVTTKRNEGGTGLGLNITYNLVFQQLEGSIEVDTTYTHGARFVIHLKTQLPEK